MPMARRERDDSEQAQGRTKRRHSDASETPDSVAKRPEHDPSTSENVHVSPQLTAGALNGSQSSATTSSNLPAGPTPTGSKQSPQEPTGDANGGAHPQSNNASASPPSATAVKPKTEPTEPPSELHQPSEDGADVDVDAVIATLALPDPNVQVALKFDNARSVDASVQAYAKLAGRNWTFYVQKLRVVIGRTAADRDDFVDIDLAPSKVVSRQHAVICYDLDARAWEVDVLGRNGIRIDKTFQRAGTRTRLTSGSVLEVGGVQMMFVLPDRAPRVAPAVLESRMRAEAKRQQRVNAAGSAQAHIQAHIQSQQNRGPRSETLVYQLAQPPVQQRQQMASIAQPAMPSQQPEASYPRGVAIVSRPQVAGWPYIDQDLSTDECKDIKPPFSYAGMISQAILSTPEHMMSLADIYAWISAHYAFYRHSKPGWQNSIRHNLSLNKAFEKVARKEHEPGKGSKWQIVAEFKEEFVLKAATGRQFKSSLTTRYNVPRRQRQSSPQQAQQPQQSPQMQVQLPPQSQSQSQPQPQQTQPQSQHQQQQPQQQTQQTQPGSQVAMPMHIISQTAPGPGPGPGNEGQHQAQAQAQSQVPPQPQPVPMQMAPMSQAQLAQFQAQAQFQAMQQMPMVVGADGMPTQMLQPVAGPQAAIAYNGEEHFGGAAMRYSPDRANRESSERGSAPPPDANDKKAAGMRSPEGRLVGLPLAAAAALASTPQLGAGGPNLPPPSVGNVTQASSPSVWRYMHLSSTPNQPGILLGNDKSSPPQPSPLQADAKKGKRSAS